MTKQEFISNYQRQQQGINRRLAIWMLVLFVGIMAMIPLNEYIEKKEFNGPEVKNLAIFILIGLLGSFAGLLWYAIRQQNRLNHHCPHCQKPLIGFAASIAIASGNCCECGGKVFDGDST